MNGITLFMAFVDAIPVVIFLFAALCLMKDFGEDVNEKGIWNYTLLSSGALMLFAGAILKVAWKTLYALNICDYTTLSESFFPMQTIGFSFMAMGIIGQIIKDIKKSKVARLIVGIVFLLFNVFLIVSFANAKSAGVDTSTEVFVYESHMPFLLGTFIAFTVVQVCLMVLAAKRKSKIFILAFVFSLLFMIAEALVGSMFDGTSGMHWVAQFIHIFAEIGLLIGAKGIYKNKSKV